MATEKKLGFAGHPPGGMPLKAVRANLGVASKPEGDAISLGTIGEWSNKEGRATITMVVRVPSNLKVELVNELGGAESLAIDRATTTPGSTVGHWYTSTTPASGWQRLTLEADPRHLAASGT